jgi:hypothetical protein
MERRGFLKSLVALPFLKHALPAKCGHAIGFIPGKLTVLGMTELKGRRYYINGKLYRKLVEQAGEV